MQRDRIFGEINAALLFEFLAEVIDEELVEVFAAQERVAVGREYFELLFAVNVSDLNDRDVKRAAAEVVHDELAVFFHFVDTERERSSGRFVDDALDVEARDAARVFGGLTLRVIEVRRHRDHGLGDFVAEVILSGFLHFAQRFGRDGRRRNFLAAHFDPSVAVVVFYDGVRHQRDVFLHFFFFEAATDQTFHGEDRVLRIGHGLALGWRADGDFAVFHIGDDGRRGARAFGVFDDFRLTAFDDGDARVGGAEVNTDDLAHDSIPLFFWWRDNKVPLYDD